GSHHDPGCNHTSRSNRQEERQQRCTSGNSMKLNLCVFVAAFMMARCAAAQGAHPLYPSGQFPPGQFYNTASVRTLIGKVIPNPAYLVGVFVYIPSKDET